MTIKDKIKHFFHRDEVRTVPNTRRAVEKDTSRIHREMGVSDLRRPAVPAPGVTRVGPSADRPIKSTSLRETPVREEFRPKAKDVPQPVEKAAAVSSPKPSTGLPQSQTRPLQQAELSRDKLSTVSVKLPMTRNIPPPLAETTKSQDLVRTEAPSYRESWHDNTGIANKIRAGDCLLESGGRSGRQAIVTESDMSREAIHTVNEPVVNLKREHHYEHRLQRHILHERHIYEHEHVLQPVRERVTEQLSEQTDSFPASFHEHTHAPDDNHHATRTQARSVVDKGTKVSEITLPEVHRYVEEEPIIREVIIRHLTKEIHPVIERHVIIPHRVLETQVVKEVHHEPLLHRDVVVADHLSVEEWLKLVKELKAGLVGDNDRKKSLESTVS